MIYKRKDFLSLIDTSAEEINFILETAETMKYVISQKNKKSPYLQGRSVIMLFYESSVRAKLSYELAAQYLSANIIDLDVCSSADIREPISNIGKTIDQMGGDFIIIRHPMAGTAKFLAKNVDACVINAGDGGNENPSQALLDLLTIKTKKGGFEGLKVVIVGDVLNSRVSRSNIWGLLKLGAEVHVVGPPTLIPKEIASFGVKVSFNLEQAITDADVIMALKLQDEGKYGSLLPSFNDYKNFFKIDKEILKHAKPDVVVMHPGIVNRSIEISSAIVDSQQILLDDQITNVVSVRMALMYILSMKGGGSI